MNAKKETIAKFARKDGDTGSPEVQIALLSDRIKHLTAHLQKNKKDCHTKRGLLALVNRRRKLLKYLAKENFKKAEELASVFSLHLR
jgi:small subunit ribosomal protein S15